jgi:hypothetical protein
MDVVFWTLAYFGVGVISGTIFVGSAVFLTWRQGDDLTLGDGLMLVWIFLMLFLFWPVVAVQYSVDYVRENWRFNGNAVILRGSKSAKTFRALRDGDHI